MHRVEVDAGRVVVELEAVAEVPPHASSLGRQRAQPEAAVELVARGDHRERLPPGALPERGCIGERRAQERLDPGEGVRRKPHRAVRAAGADRPAGARRVADEALDRAALGAAGHVRKVAREPEQLELERERERIDRRPQGRAGDEPVGQVEEARQRLEGARVSLLLVEEPQHRLRPDQGDTEAVGLLARPRVRAQEIDAGDRAELARALVVLERDVRERLEPRPEAALRLADALRDRPEPAVLARIQVKHPVGLAEADRAEHDGLRLQRARHAPSLEPGEAALLRAAGAEKLVRGDGGADADDRRDEQRLRT